MSAHPSSWTLQRLHAGERDFPGADAAQAHATDCLACRQQLQAHVRMQAEFEGAISFERFAAGVERRAEPARRAPVRTLVPRLAMAAVALLAVSASLQLGAGTGRNRVKGGAQAVELRVGGGEGSAQRSALPGEPERLAPGERVRLGYAAGDGYVLAVSVDAAGAVSALYPESGESLPAERGEGMRYLPDSLEFTGTGLERVVLVRSRQPLPVESVKAAVARAFQAAGGEVSAMGALDVDGEQTQWLLVKP